MIWAKEMFSFKKYVAKKKVKIGPMLAIIEAFPEPTLWIPSESRNVGMTVEMTDIEKAMT